MSSVTARSRLIASLSKRKRRFLSSGLASNPPKEPLIAAETLAADQPPPPAAAAAPSSKSWGFLKYSLVAALTGATAGVGYASYGSRL